MTVPSQNPITELLAAVTRGEDGARGQLWSLIYQELHGIAQQQLAGRKPGDTLQPTALVHEAYLRMTADEGVQWQNRRHFFAAAARAMRQIRVDDVRKRRRLKRGGGQRPGPLQEGPPVFDQDPAEVLAIDEALGELEQRYPRKAEVVMLRFFIGLTVEECAEVLRLATRTVEKDWQFARTWLHLELSKG